MTAACQRGIGRGRRLFAFAAMVAIVSSIQSARASDFSHACRSADGVYEVNDEQLTRTADASETGKEIAYRKVSETQISRETGYCIVNDAGGARYDYEAKSYTMRIAFEDQGRTAETDVLCEFASDGLPAAYTCDKQVVTLREGAAGSAAPSGAPNTKVWTHNGSVMRLVAEGAERKFLYDSPRAGIAKQGVRRGTLLFKGTRDGSSYSGVAYIFKAGCDPEPYDVTGEVSTDDNTVTMTGQAPRLDGSCNVTGTKEDVLVFKYVRGD